MNHPLKIKLTDADINKIVKGVLFHLKETIDNPFTIPEKKRAKMLTEGIFMTYPPEKVEKYLKKRYGKYAFVERYKNENNIDLFRIGFYNDEDSKKTVDNDMALCGYFPSLEHITPDSTTIYVTYEPKHQDNVNDKVFSKDYIFHLTPTSKIKNKL